MKYLLLLLLFIAPYVYSQGNATFYFIFNDSKLSRDDIKRKMNFLIENSDAKKTKFEIVHYSNKFEEYNSWSSNKSSVNYKPTRIGCEFDLCSTLSSIFSITKTDKSRLFLTDKKINCDSGIESSQLPNKDTETIIEKLNEEITRIKNLKSTQTTFFLFTTDQISTKPTLEFKPDKITVKESEMVRLSPLITGEIVQYSWVPQIGLSCTNCPNPELKAQESSKYTLTVKDSSGCNTLSATVDIEVEKNCVCNRGLEKIEIQFGKLPIKKFEKKTPGLIADWEWRVISNQSGGYVFDVITNANCAKKFRVKVLRQNGGEIFDQIYNREDVDSRSRNPYHEKYPDKFVFRIDLSDDDSYKLIEDAEKEPYFLIEIISIDDLGIECLEKKYTSPKIRPTKCN
jgi:hypothetical protein